MKSNVVQLFFIVWWLKLHPTCKKIFAKNHKKLLHQFFTSLINSLFLWLHLSIPLYDFTLKESQTITHFEDLKKIFNERFIKAKCGNGLDCRDKNYYECMFKSSLFYSTLQLLLKCVGEQNVNLVKKFGESMSY